MDKEKEYQQDIIDEDLYEELDDEEMEELLATAHYEGMQKEKLEEGKRSSRSPLTKFLLLLVALALFFNILAFIPQTFSIPAVEFLLTSAKLSSDPFIREMKKAVVVIETEDSKGTGFAISEKGDILTNHHVVEGSEEVTVAFPNLGLFEGRVKERLPEVDLSLVEIEGENIPCLPLATEFSFQETSKEVFFIGNPLQFHGIANEGEVLDWTYVQGKELPMVMLDAPVYRGNSGSPVLNREGEVIGVIFATTHSQRFGRVGLFIPIQYAKENLKAWKET